MLQRSLPPVLLLLLALLTSGCASVFAAPDNMVAGSATPAAAAAIPTLTTLPTEAASPTLPPTPTPEPTRTLRPTETTVPTATATPEPTLTSTPNPDAEIEYTVKEGDTPGEIAILFGVDVDEMLAYNGITDPTKMPSGATLRIPVGEARVAAMRATVTAIAQAAPPTPPPAANVELPARVVLEMSHTYQKPNNCAPSATSMALSYYGLNKTQFDMAAFQKPVPQDVNVTAEEVADSIRAVGMRAFIGINGNTNLMVRLLAAGFPVMTEEWMAYDGGMGHFRVLRGYDLSTSQLLYNDSYYGANLWRGYDAFERDWRSYNNKYVIPYRAEQEATLRAIIGADWDAATMYEGLRATAQAEVTANPGNGYAWWGLGEALLWQGNPTDASYAFEQALATSSLPWRYLWYRYGYFEALNELGRYEDVLTVTHNPLNQMGRSEDIRYHRAVALRGLGRPDEALVELRQAIKENPRFAPAAALLAEMGG